jgi:ribosome-binding protein aMBF1 (putative translation factor)
MAHDLVCWKCGASLAHLSLPLLRREECASCRAELHVCRMCQEYDTHVAKHCREPTAEEVSDKTHANFCDHFKPRAAAYLPPNSAELDRSRSELEKLFGRK